MVANTGKSKTYLEADDLTGFFLCLQPVSLVPSWLGAHSVLWPRFYFFRLSASSAASFKNSSKAGFGWGFCLVKKKNQAKCVKSSEQTSCAVFCLWFVAVLLGAFSIAGWFWVLGMLNVSDTRVIWVVEQALRDCAACALFASFSQHSFADWRRW